jgi:translation initiation factor 1
MKDEYIYSYSLGDEPKKYNTDMKKNSKFRAPDDGALRLGIEKNHRGGKTVSLIYGFKPTDDIEKIAVEIKKKCGTGGTVKDGVVEIQGDNRDKIEKYLTEKGYKVKRTGG